MIGRLFERLRPLFHWSHQHPYLVVAACLLTAALGAFQARTLHIDSDFSHLIPSSYPSVQALNTLRTQVGGASEVSVIIESPSFEANRRFADTLVSEALDLAPRPSSDLSVSTYFTYADYRRDTDFLRQNALYFATEAELNRLEAHLRSQAREARLRANPFYFDLDVPETDTAGAALADLEAFYEQFVGTEYPISPDSTTMVLNFYPGEAQTNIAFIEAVYRDLRTLVDALGPTAYHPQMEVTLAGRLLRQLAEVDAIVSDIAGSFGAGVGALLLLVMGYFFYRSYQIRTGPGFSRRVFVSELVRTPVTAVLLGLPLLVSLAWTFGVVALTYGMLNLMTSTLFLVLFGLGIDFGIHFYARYAEERGEGRSVAAALDRTVMTTGQAIAVVGLTTAAAFYILLIADFRGFSQFGFTAGTGTLFALLAMLVLLPALLGVSEHLGLLRLDRHPARTTPSANGAPSPSSSPSRLAVGILGMSLVATGLAVTQLPAVQFEYDFGALEPTYEAYEDLQRKTDPVPKPKTTHRNAAYVLTETAADAAAVADSLRARAARDTISPTIADVETLQDRFPLTPEAQQRKLAHLADLRTLLADRALRQSDDPTLARLRTAARTTRPIPVDSIPAVVKNPFLTKEDSIAHLVIVSPAVGLADGRNSMAFADDVGTVRLPNGRVYHAASTSIVASDMLRLMIREAPWMVGLTVLMIVLFKWIALRRVRWVLMALLPLAASFVWMFGLMPLLGWRLNFYNLVVLPTVLGIGDDSGIHIVHRYLEEGRGSIRRVLTSTGEHISVSAVTTMVGFGSLLLSTHPGLRTIGELAVLGISMTLLAALVTLPALLYWLERPGADRTPDPAPHDTPFHSPSVPD